MTSLEFEKLRNKVGRKFRKYIQLRDLVKKPNGDIVAHCIDCPKEEIIYSSWQLRDWVAGHYYKEKGSSGCESVALNEWNVNLQNAHCNTRMHGNEANYEINLRIKIGDERFEKLKRLKNEIKKYSFGELQELDREYSKKIKVEQERLGKKW
jgi:hypothetical protein